MNIVSPTLRARPVPPVSEDVRCHFLPPAFEVYKSSLQERTVRGSRVVPLSGNQPNKFPSRETCKLVLGRKTVLGAKAPKILGSFSSQNHLPTYYAI